MPYADPESRRTYCRKRYAEDPVYRAKALARSRCRDKLKFNDYRREWRKRDYVRQKERQYMLKWESRHPHRNAEHSALWRSRILATTIEAINYNKVILSADGKCQICFEPFEDGQIHIDHVIPLSRGGTHTYDNLQATHALCNQRKWAHITDGRR